MIPHIEYHCDTEGCNARLFDIVSEQGVIEVKCPKCKQTIQVDVEELYFHSTDTGRNETVKLI